MGNSMIYSNLSQGKKGEAATINFLESAGCTVTDTSNNYKIGYDLVAERGGNRWTYEVKTMSKAALTNTFSFNLYDLYWHFEQEDVNRLNALEQHDRKGWFYDTKADFLTVWVGLGTCGPKNSEYSDPIMPSEVVTQYVFKMSDLKKLVKEYVSAICVFSGANKQENFDKACLLTREQEDWKIGSVLEEHVEDEDSYRWAGKVCRHQNYIFKPSIDWLVEELKKRDLYVRTIKFAYSESGNYTVAAEMKGE